MKSALGKYKIHLPTNLQNKIILIKGFVSYHFLIKIDFMEVGVPIKSTPVKTRPKRKTAIFQARA